MLGAICKRSVALEGEMMAMVSPTTSFCAATGCTKAKKELQTNQDCSSFYFLAYPSARLTLP